MHNQCNNGQCQTGGMMGGMPGWHTHMMGGCGCAPQSQCSTEKCKGDELMDAVKCAKKCLFKDKLKAKLEEKMGKQMDKMVDMAVEMFMGKMEMKKQMMMKKGEMMEKMKAMMMGK